MMAAFIFLTPKITLVLQLLGDEVSRAGLIVVAPMAVRIVRIDLRHGVKEGSAGILHEVPAIRHLDSLRQNLSRGLTITATASMARRSRSA